MANCWRCSNETLVPSIELSTCKLRVMLNRGFYYRYILKLTLRIFLSTYGYCLYIYIHTYLSVLCVKPLSCVRAFEVGWGALAPPLPTSVLDYQLLPSAWLELSNTSRKFTSILGQKNDGKNYSKVRVSEFILEDWIFFIPPCRNCYSYKVLLHLNNHFVIANNCAKFYSLSLYDNQVLKGATTLFIMSFSCKVLLQNTPPSC